MFATVGELAGVWQGLRAKVTQSSHCSVQFDAAAVAVDVLETNVTLFAARDGGKIDASKMNDVCATATASQVARHWRRGKS